MEKGKPTTEVIRLKSRMIGGKQNRLAYEAELVEKAKATIQKFENKGSK